jgi:hypothetical protein
LRSGDTALKNGDELLTKGDGLLRGDRRAGGLATGVFVILSWLTRFGRSLGGGGRPIGGGRGLPMYLDLASSDTIVIFGDIGREISSYMEENIISEE